MDPRETPSNGRVAHVSLEGKVEAERFVEGTTRRVGWPPYATLWRSPGGAKDREVLFGEAFRVLETRQGFAYGIAERDGYVGYLEAHTLTDLPTEPTHRVAVRLTYGLAEPDVKTKGEHLPLSYDSPVLVTAQREDWCEIDTGTNHRHVPSRHLRPAAELASDPASVAELFLHAPYVWGGNTSFGIDCSGLAQTALLACGIASPGDSDLQEKAVGRAVPPEAPLQRNDLVFWKGHVAIAVDMESVIHANAHHMAVVVEPLEVARARIEASGGGGVTSVRRP